MSTRKTTKTEKIELEKKEPEKKEKMTTEIEFLNTASRNIVDFDGEYKNLQTFLDSIDIVDKVKGDFEHVVVSVIKSKLKGDARRLITTETTISEIIETLNDKVKGESDSSISAKLMSLKQNNKPASTYCTEVKALTNSLKTCYISEGIPYDVAEKYSLNVAKRAMIKNCSNESVKLILKAGTFKKMDEMISQFIDCSIDGADQQNTILYYNRRRNNSYGRYNNYNNNNNWNRNTKNGYRNNNNNNNNNGQNRNNNNRWQRSNNRRGARGNRNGNGNFVRTANQVQNSSDFQDIPLGSDL